MATSIRMRVIFLATSTCFICLPKIVSADDKQMALDWMDSFRAQQVLLYDSDVVRIRTKLANATDEQVKSWLKKTQSVRDRLDGAEWQATREWFREFLEVQAIYSDEQISRLHKQAKELFVKSPDQFHAFLTVIDKKRIALAPGADETDRFRQQMLAMNESYRRQQLEHRQTSTASTSLPIAELPRTPRSERRYNRTPPLINSLNVARWTALWGYLPRW